MLVRYYPGVGTFVTAFMVVALCAPLPTGAAEWSVEPSVRAARQYNDNVNNTLQSRSAVYITSVEPILNLGVRSDIWQINGNIDYTKNRFTPVTDLDNNNQRFALSSSYQTERSSWQLSGTSENTAFITERNLGGNIGYVQANQIRNNRSISPTWTWSMTQMMRLQLTYQMSDVSYVNGESVLLYDYRVQSTTISLLKQINSLDLVSVNAGYSYYRVPKTGIISRSTNIQAGLTSQFTETLKGTITAGARNTTTVIPGGVPLYNFNDPGFQQCVSFANFIGVNWQDYCSLPFVGYTKTQRTEKTSTIYNLNLEKSFENIQFNFALSRSVEPNPTGSESITNWLSLGLEKPLAEKLTGYFTVSGYTSSTIAGNVTGVDYRVYHLEPKLRWQWTREMSVDGAYRYDHLKRNSENMPVVARSVSLSLTYNWPKMAISR